jgi:gliding motility-associated-like protein
MIDKNKHIDELLKQSFEQFQPEAPDVWDAVSNQVNQINLNGADQVAQSTQAATSGFSITAKIAVAITSVATISTIVYYVYTDTLTQEQPQPTPKPVEQVEEISINEDLLLQQNQSQSVNKNTTVATPKPIQNQTESIKHTREDKLNDYRYQEEQTTQSNLATTTNSVNATQSNHPASVTNQNRKSYTPPIPNKDEVLSKVQADTKEQEPITEANTKLDIPNVFTPNYDGVNDEFVVYVPQAEWFHIRIVNRRGQTVYESNNKDQYWNGRWMQSGEDCEAGEYIYTLKFSTKSEEEQIQIGKIVILR